MDDDGTDPLRFFIVLIIALRWWGAIYVLVGVGVAWLVDQHDRRRRPGRPATMTEDGYAVQRWIGFVVCVFMWPLMLVALAVGAIASWRARRQYRPVRKAR